MQQPQAISEPGADDDNKEPNDFSALKNSKNPKDAKAPQPAANSKPKPGKRPPLRSTGQKVPTLYAD